MRHTNAYKEYDDFLPGDKISVSPAITLSNTSHSVGKIKKGQVIHFPRLTKTAMEYFAKLFEDAMYSDGFPFQQDQSCSLYV